MNELFFSLAGVVLSLAFSYIPGLNAKWDALEGSVKRLVMLGLIAVIAGVYFGLSCTSLAPDLNITVTCDKAGGLEVVKAFVLCMMANQATYQITKG